jgi:hypothetical protein
MPCASQDYGLPGRGFGPKKFSSALKGEPVRSSKTLVYIYQIIRRYIPEHRNDIVTCIPIARQRLGKHIPARANAHKNRTSIARQRISKHAYSTAEVVFSMGSVRSGYKEVFGRIESSRESEESSLETPACRDMSLGAEELNWVGYSELAAAE